jgi:uncharacterized protein (DUF4213/DUF364 family)
MNNLSKLQSESVKELNERFVMSKFNGNRIMRRDVCKRYTTPATIKNIEQFLLDQIQKAVSETIKEDIKTINEIIQMSNENSSTEWFDALRCAKESIKGLSIQSKEK